MKIRSCIGVNEIINTPLKFVSSHPFLVAPPELIRPKYLLVFGDNIANQIYLSAPNATELNGEKFQIPNSKPQTDVTQTINQQLSRGVGEGSFPGDDPNFLKKKYLGNFEYAIPDRNKGIQSLRPPSFKKQLVEAWRSRKNSSIGRPRAS